jgi:hypothetical protein
MSNDLEIVFTETCGSMLQALEYLLDWKFVRFTLDNQALQPPFFSQPSYTGKLFRTPVFSHIAATGMNGKIIPGLDTESPQQVISGLLRLAGRIELRKCIGTRRCIE